MSILRGKCPNDAISIMKRAKYFFFDMDSTLSNQEGIDELARYIGKYGEISEITESAMNGSLSIEEAFEKRVTMLNVPRETMQSFLRIHHPAVNPGVLQFLHQLRMDKREIYVVSGGFYDLIMPVCERCGIDRDHVLCNSFIWNSNDQICDFDHSSFTWRSHGKSLAIRSILKNELKVGSVMIGDGVTDLEASDSVDAFICYYGIKERRPIMEASHLAVDSFISLLNLYSS